jgi:acyl transferase domain-containing protein
MQSLPSGTMLAVVLPEAEVTPLLTEGLSLAAVNGPKLCVVSGPEDIVAAFARSLAEKKIATRELKTSHAFHSAMMDPILAAFAAEVAQVPRHPPQIPIVSSLHGRLGTDDEWMSPAYWSAQLRQGVRFADSVGVLLAQPSLVLLEVGPGQSLTTLARQNPAKPPAQVTIYSSPKSADESEAVEFLSAAGQLWTAGIEIGWTALHGGQPRRRVPLPTYPFERKRHWIDAHRPGEGLTPVPTQTHAVPEVETNGLHLNGSAPSLSEIEALVDEQLRIMARQIEVLRAAPPSAGTKRSTRS